MTPEGALRGGLAIGTVLADTAVFAPAALALATAFGPTHPLVSACIRGFAQTALFGFRAHVRSNGDAHLPADRRYVFVSNHASHLDAPAILCALARHPVRFVAKEDLGRIPLFGWALRATGNVMVRRSDTVSDVRRLDDAQDALLTKVSVLFFAEGTRSQTGELGEFKRGAAAFALKSGLALVPIGVHGSFDIYARGLEVKRGGAIGVAIGAPIESRGRAPGDRDGLTALLRAAVGEQLAEARKLASGG